MRLEDSAARKGTTGMLAGYVRAVHTAPCGEGGEEHLGTIEKF